MVLKQLFKQWSYRIIAPGTILREKYGAFKRLLQADINCHEHLAELQELEHGGLNRDLAYLRNKTSFFSNQVAEMVTALEEMAPGKYGSLKSYHKKFDFYIRFLLAPPKITPGKILVAAAADITEDTGEVGNKAKNLAVIEKNLNIKTPRGFTVTTAGYYHFIAYNSLRERIDQLLAELDISSQASLFSVSEQLTALISDAEWPPELNAQIQKILAQVELDDPSIRFAIRSSTIFEDGEITFAGQYDSRLNIPHEDISKGYREVLGSKYSPEALFYRIKHGLDDEETGMAVLVQEMVEAGCSGVLYSQNPQGEATDTSQLEIFLSTGLGDRLTGGAIVPQRIAVNRAEPHQLSSGSDKCGLLSPEQLQTLTRHAIQIENHFNTFQDIEWALSKTGELFILQARPLHLHPRPSSDSPRTITVNSAHKILLSNCESASAGVGAGEVFLLQSAQEMDTVPAGAVLVIRDSPPGYVRILNKINAVVAEHGSRASHFATVAREFGVPYVAAARGAMAKLQNANRVTVDAHLGIIYQGHVKSLLGARHPGPRKTSYHRVITETMKFISPLELIDPRAENFAPEGCRSMHDIIRFCHEKGVLSMFSSEKPGSGRGSVKIKSNIALDVYLFDVGGALPERSDSSLPVPVQAIQSIPFQALWQGLSHPGIKWQLKPFDWEAYDKLMLSGGVVPRQDSFSFASYSVASKDYLHFNLRFGYHFTIVDVMCSDNSAENHCLMRFGGGGGDYEHRVLRIEFIAGVLDKLHFSVEKKGDLLEAKTGSLERQIMEEKLDLLGRLLGATKLMDMVLQDRESVDNCIDDFFKGRYSFSERG